MDTTTTPRALPASPLRASPKRAADPAEPCCDSGCASGCDGTVAPPTIDVERTARLADRLKALADPTRLRMLDLLVQQRAPLCVCEITDQFALHQPTISHHLRILREAGLIRGEKRGTWAYYSATDEGRRCVSAVRDLA